MVRKRYAGLLSAMLVFALLIGCSNNGTKNTETQTPAAENSPKPTSSESAPPAEKPTITVAILDIQKVAPEEGTHEENRWTKWINENGPVNVKFVSIPWGEQKEKYTTMFASGDAPDLIQTVNRQFINQLIDQKLVMPLDDLVQNASTTYKSILAEYPQLDKVVRKSDGKMYEFGSVYGVSFNQIMLIRDDWLKNLGLSVPQTMDELYEVAKAFTEKDPDGNGAKDTLGINLSFIGKANLKWAFEDVEWVGRDGKMVKAWDEKSEATAFFKKLYAEGLVDKDFLTDTSGAKAEQDWLTGKLGIYFLSGANGNAGLEKIKSFKTNNPEGSFIPITFPASPSGQFGLWTVPFQAYTAVNAKAKNPEAVMQYVDFINQDDTSSTLKYGIEGENWNRGANGCPVAIDADKNALQLGYSALYYDWLYSGIKFGKCKEFVSTLDPADPNNKAFIDMQAQVDEAYGRADLPAPGVTNDAYLPKLPDDLQLIVSNVTKPISDMMDKAIVDSKYSVEQAMTDAKDLWNKSGGEKIEQFYQDWYAANTDTLITTQDVFEIYQSQINMK